ncbi:hypothetical protein SMICM304S_02704 [Streptomyces microflavus]
MTRSLPASRPMRTVFAGRGRTVVGCRKVPVAAGIETADGRSAGAAGRAGGSRPSRTARGPSDGLPKWMMLPAPTPDSWTRWPPVYVPLVLSSSWSVQ